MDPISLADDFKEFFRLLNSHEVEYLLLGGYAVAYYGYPRATNDIDLWAKVSPENAEKLASVFQDFGFSSETASPATFLEADRIVRVGVPPICIDLILSVSGIEFDDCFTRRVVDKFDGVSVSLLSFEDLKANKRASGRLKDLNDLENLPD